jgi:hypothetical protein
MWKQKKELPKRNASSMFLLPMVDEYLPNKQLYFFNNVYIEDHEHDVHYDCHALFLLFNPTFTIDYCAFEKHVESLPIFLETYDVKPGFVMHVLAVPKELEKDYESFLKGEYSEFQQTYKRKFRFGSTEFKVVNQHPELREYWQRRTGREYSDTDELWAKWKPEENIYRYNPNKIKI